MVFADMQMPMPVGGTQPKEGALAKLGAVTDASSEGFQIVYGERCPTEPASVPGSVADATAGSLEIGRGSRASAPDGRERSDLADSRVRQQGHRHLQPRVVEQVQNGRHAVVRPNDVEDDASPAGPHVMLEPPLT